MKNSSVFLVFIFAVLTLLPRNSNASTITSIDISYNWKMEGVGGPESLTFGPLIHSQSDSYSNYTKLFSVARKDVGKTLTLDTGPIFDEAAGFFTNGINDRITFSLFRDGLGIGGPMLSEANFFYGNYTGHDQLGIDLKGFIIDSIMLNVTEFTLERQGEWMESTANWTFTVNATAVPASSTISLLASGLIVLAGFRTRFKK